MFLTPTLRGTLSGGGGASAQVIHDEGTHPGGPVVTATPGCSHTIHVTPLAVMVRVAIVAPAAAAIDFVPVVPAAPAS
jgi:hypothetical protein